MFPIKTVLCPTDFFGRITERDGFSSSAGRAGLLANGWRSAGPGKPDSKYENELIAGPPA